MALTALRVFISSPGDVAFERRVAQAVLERLRGEFGAHLDIRPVIWEQQPLLASAHFQEQIASTADVDIAVFVLWTRLGTLLPGQFARDDGTPYASGTEFEFENAACAWHERGAPAMLAYLKQAERSISLADRESAMDAFAQKDALDRFVDRWFGNPRSTFRAAFKSFETADEFERLLQADLRALIVRKLPQALEVSAARPLTWSRGSPFRGLSTFEFEHAAVFFGRTRAIADVREALLAQAERGAAFLLMLGMSGAGKSSLIHAGVLPAITQPGVVEGVDLWRWCSLRPSGNQSDLLHGLARELLRGLAASEGAAPGLSEATLALLLRQSPARAADELAGLLQRIAAATTAAQGLTRPPVARLVVVIDQFEELFALADIDAEMRRHFVAAIDALARSGAVWVMAAMRSDFYSRCAELPALVRLKDGAGQYELLPPSRGEIEQMVRAAASVAGLRFERVADSGEALDDALIDAAAGHPATLPLLEFALEELYRRRAPAELMTFAAYREFGGIEGAISRRAEEIHAQLAPASQARLPEVFAHLLTVRLDEGHTRSAVRVARSSLPAGAEIDAICEAFVAARLFVSDRTASGEAALSIAHESLVTHWPRLARWAADNEAFLERRAHLMIEAQQWRHHGRDEARLIPAGLQLDDAEQFLAGHASTLPPEVAEYIGASTRLHRSTGKALWLGIGGALALLIAVTATWSLVSAGAAAVKLDQVVPISGLAIWMLFIGHLRWRAEPKRVARRKILAFTALIAAVLVFGVAWRAASGIKADNWRSEMINDVGGVMVIVYGIHVALDLMSTASADVRARRRRRFWVLFGIATTALFATVPTGLIFDGGPADSVPALLLLLAVAVAVLVLSHATVRSRAVAGGELAAQPAARPRDRLADTVLALSLISLPMAVAPSLVDRARADVALCGDIDGVFDPPNLRCTAAPRPGATVIRLERKSRGAPISVMRIVNAEGQCEGRRMLPPLLELLRDLDLIESGLDFDEYCLSEFDHDAAGKRVGEMLRDAGGKRLAYFNLSDDAVHLYGATSGIYLGRLRAAPDARDGELTWLAEFNPHHLWTSDTDGRALPMPSRRWVFHRSGRPVRISILDAQGKPALVARYRYASVEMSYADNGNGALAQALFLDAEERPIAVKSGATRMSWEYESDGACARRRSFAADGSELAVQPCR